MRLDLESKLLQQRLRRAGVRRAITRRISKVAHQRLQYIDLTLEIRLDEIAHVTFPGSNPSTKRISAAIASPMSIAGDSAGL